MAEVNKHPSEILVILLYAVVQLSNVRPLQEAQDRFLQLAASLAGNDFDTINPFGNGIPHDLSQSVFNGPSFIKNIMKIDL